jgi:hypothetical protein
MARRREHFLCICVSAYLGNNIIMKKTPTNQEGIIRHRLKKMFLQVLMCICVSVIF